MKSLFKQMGGTYQEENGYLIPNPTSPAEKEVKPVGVGVDGRYTYEIFVRTNEYSIPIC